MSTRGRMPARDVWAVTASYRLYNVFLRAYPLAFRRVYGVEIARLFRDCCRDAWESGRTLAVLGLWGRALVDLAVAAASERMKAGVPMSRTTVIRAAGLAGLIAGGAYTLLFATTFALSSSTNFNIYPGDANTMWMNSDVIATSLPAMWLLFALALLGLHLYLARQTGAIRWLVGLAAAVTCTGALLLLVSGPLALQSVGSNTPVEFYFEYYYSGAHYGFTGYVVLGIGLLGTGWVALRTRALGHLAWVPLMAGILALVDAVFVSDGLWRMLYANYVPYAPLIWIAIQIAFYLVWSIGWVALGRRLWSRPAPPTPKEAIASLVG